jgi:hypothetical protein
VRLVEYRERDAETALGFPVRVGELIGECGHVVENVRPAAFYFGVVDRGKRRRCR